MKEIDNDYACQYPFQRLAVSTNGIIVPCTGSYNEEETSLENIQALKINL